MKQNSLIIELHYLPSIQYFVYFNYYKNIFIDPADNYIKQSFRNRCRINGANKPEDLIIPIKKIPPPKKTIQMEIDYQQKWLNKHLRAIQSAYGKAPFFEYYAEDLLAVYQKKHEFLFDLTHELLTQCLDFLQFDVTLKFTTAYHSLEKTPQNDFRSKINPKSTPDIINTYTPFIYQQVFGNNFVNNLSVIDLIFCEGPQAGVIIKSGIAEGTH